MKICSKQVYIDNEWNYSDLELPAWKTLQDPKSSYLKIPLTQELHNLYIFETYTIIICEICFSKYILLTDLIFKILNIYSPCWKLYICKANP